MKKVTTILAICVVVMLTGCNDYLDIKPKGEKIPTTVSDYETLLNYESVQKVSDTYPAYLTDDVFLPDVAEGTATPGLNSVDQSIRNLYLFKKEVFGDAQDDGFWFASYNRIYYYNTVIDNIMNADGSDEQQKLSIRAEALISRALEYLYLVNGYAKYYDVRTAESDPGVPLILDEDISKKNLVRASVKDVYAQIQSDLQTALPNLPMQAKGNAFRASKAAGYGVLAKMYLYMGNYAEALKAANAVLEMNNSLLDLKKYAVVKAQSSIGRTNVPQDIDNPENIYIKFAPYVYGLSSKVFGSDELISLFSEDDMRLQVYFTKNFRNIPTDKYVWAPYLRANLAVSSPEIYLIAAECEAREGSIERAIALINKLRDNRIKNNTDIVATDRNDALQKVLEERRRELAMSGMVRYIDLKRLNQESQFAKTVTHVTGEGTFSLEPNSPLYVLPIPAKVMRFNKNSMQQNER
ncbi:RagB/SusD family nutrient uptake outer membrane protein [Prevotella melaninogenica]|jgi:tetratricopeptide repeat protein|uniref:RagB/SusD family nutrient uptake outer membrane protein n=1 Tax=Prevotella melaninogenica TaxID=28132 RepID=UPI001C5CE91A|nr:RagB/SusD family nutrient uptake outer membrane protein [Prevotella melaninogenica]MBW4895432.1 RagB/SusD family nutrient uptake outer membrane protein [Prevotella melaninogenica]